MKGLMNGKRGWIRVAEAFTAVLIVLSVLILMSTRAPRPDVASNIHEAQRYVLEQISNNDSLRADILNNDTDNVNLFVKNALPTYLNFTVRVCEIGQVCAMDSYVDKEIYADEILISSTLHDYNPKELKLFVWEK